MGCRTQPILLRRWLNGFGFPYRTPTFSSRAPRPGGPSSRPIGRLVAVRNDFSAGRARRRIPLRDTCVHRGCSAYIGDSRGIASMRGWASWCALLDVNRKDPVEMALVIDLQRSSLAHVAESPCGTYTGPINLVQLIVAWYDAKAEPRWSLPALMTHWRCI